MNIGVHVSFWTMFFSECMPRSGTTGSCSSSIFSSLTPYTKVNSKWTKDLNVRLYIMKLEKKLGKALFDINLGNIFFVPSPRLMEIKTKIYKWDLIILKSLCTVKISVNKVKRQPMGWEQIFTTMWPSRGWSPKFTNVSCGSI